GRMRRIGQDAVIAPAARASELRDGHQLDRGNAERGEVAEALGGGRERALRRESAAVKLVDDSLFPGAAAPVRLAPCEGSVVDDDRWAMHASLLKLRSGIRDQSSVVHHETVRSP